MSSFGRTHDSPSCIHSLPFGLSTAAHLDRHAVGEASHDFLARKPPSRRDPRQSPLWAPRYYPTIATGAQFDALYCRLSACDLPQNDLHRNADVALHAPTNQAQNSRNGFRPDVRVEARAAPSALPWHALNRHAQQPSRLNRTGRERRCSPDGRT